jgi:hypothetical protein
MVVELGVLEVRFDATGCMYILWREVEVGAVKVLVPKPVAEHSRIHHQPWMQAASTRNTGSLSVFVLIARAAAAEAEEEEVVVLGQQLVSYTQGW